MSSLYAIRDLETTGIGDPLEGAATKSGRIFLEPESADEDQRLILDYEKMQVSLRGGIAESIHCTFSDILPNVLMYCVSTAPNNTYWKNEYNYVPALHIHNSYKFVEKIWAVIPVHFNEYRLLQRRVGRCVYEQPISISDPTPLEPSFFRKTISGSVNYQQQCEARAIFIFDNGDRPLPTSIDVKIDYDDGNAWVF